MMITKPEQHDTNRAGKLLLRQVLEPLKWVLNDTQEDYGIDCCVQVFQGLTPTGAWFHVQLKSSVDSAYSANGEFVSQELEIDHARHYAQEMRDPIFLIHSDVTAGKVYWHSPQLDRKLISVLGKTRASSITVRIPTCQQLPQTAPALLSNLDTIYLVLGGRELSSTSLQNFAESLVHFPNQEALHRDFQEKNDALKLQRIFDLFQLKEFQQARLRIESLMVDPDSTTETKFWAQKQLVAIEFTETVHAGKPQNELPKVLLAHAKSLQKLTAAGPKYLKFSALISRQAAELEILTQDSFGIFMALEANVKNYGNPMLAIDLYARRSALTRRIVSQYNRCVRLARYAATYPDRWALGRALADIVKALGPFLVTVRAEKDVDVETNFVQSALQISKLAAWICRETGDSSGIPIVIGGALAISGSPESPTYQWADKLAHSLLDQKTRDDALTLVERTGRRLRGESVEGDYEGETVWQAIQNMATSLGIDVSNEQDPLVIGLRLAAKDDDPERVLAKCEHILVTRGATGPIARQIQLLFNTSQAGSKVVNCTLHDFHVEAKSLDAAYAEFKKGHCDSCPDQKPRPEGWRHTLEARREMQQRHRSFVARLKGCYAFRYTSTD
jgi:hypothetical protein